ncbi:MAG: acyl-CoA dehydrogenase family protein [Acidimicrobiales bacterium]
MEFELTYTDEQEAFRREVTEFFDRVLPPDLSERPKTQEESRAKYLQRRAFGRQLGERGWLYPYAPKEYGGGNLGFDLVLVLEEESHRRGLRIPPYYDSGGKYGSATILVWGTDEQKQRLLPPIYRGEVRTWQLLSEPNAGSDLAGVESLAVRDGDDYVLNGQKIYVGSDHGCDRIWLIALTGPKADRHRNLSWFMIDATSPGIDVQPQVLLSSIGEGEGDVGNKNTVYFNDVRIPAENLVGGENNGWPVASTHLELEHGAIGSIGRDRIWRRLIDYCTAEVRDGERLIDNPDVRDKLAEIYERLESVRLLALRNFWMVASKSKRSYEGSQFQYVKKTTGLWLTKAILEIIGPAALVDDDIWGAMNGFAEEQQREGIVGMHPGGTTDIGRLIIARRLGLGKREAERAGTLHQ